jgi:ABC-2 type transport system permease protein
MRPVLLLAAKDLRLVARDKLGLFWTLGFPLMLALLFAAIFSGDGSPRAIMIAVADGDRTAASEALVKSLAESDALKTVRLSAEEAREEVRRGRLAAVVIVREGFGATLGFFGADPQAGPPIEIGIDPGKRAEAGLLEGVVMEKVFEGVQAQFRDPAELRRRISAARGQAPLDENLRRFLGDLDRYLDGSGPGGVEGFRPMRIRRTPIAAGAQPARGFDLSLPSAILWGLIACASTFAITLVRERTSGTLLRLRISPVSRAGILAGKALACFATCLAVMTLLLAMGVLVFDVQVGSFGALALGVGCSAACFVGIMMMMSVAGRTEAAVAGAGWAVMTPMAMIGGGGVPLAFMPPWMQSMSHFSPVTWGILSIEGALWRGFGFAEMLMPCSVLLSVGLFSFSTGVWLFHRFGADR